MDESNICFEGKWALVYGRQNFCAYMMTTQRNESMNNVIKKYVSYKHDMLRFFQHFERLVDDRRYQQLKADFKATQRNVSLSFNVEIVRQATTIYAPAVFKMFQSEVSLSYDCSVITSFEVENVSEYKIMHYNKHFQHTVKYDSTNGVVTCSCKKFEFARILCSHALKVLSIRNIMRIPMIYVLKRWTKQAKIGSDRGTCLSPTNDDQKAGLRNRYKDLCGRYTELTTKGATNEETYKIVVNTWNKAMEAIDACIGGGENEIYTHDTSPIGIENVLCIESTNNKVNGIKTKGKLCGSSRRPKSILEKRREKKLVYKKMNLLYKT
ncbi:hypothetical protein Lal_00025860 [Lupinus albus]|nr:hypothetical protein Lal_00025860 [Lupinus albus]